MERKYTVLIFIFVILAVAFAVLYIAETQNGTTPLSPVSQDPSEEDGDQSDVPRRAIIATKTFDNGVHFIEGMIELPTPCHELIHKIAIAESFPEQVTILFESSGAAEICIQVISEVPFSFEIAVSERATFAARLNNQPVDLVFASKNAFESE